MSVYKELICEMEQLDNAAPSKYLLNFDGGYTWVGMQQVGEGASKMYEKNVARIREIAKEWKKDERTIIRTEENTNGYAAKDKIWYEKFEMDEGGWGFYGYVICWETTFAEYTGKIKTIKRVGVTCRTMTKKGRLF